MKAKASFYFMILCWQLLSLVKYRRKKGVEVNSISPGLWQKSHPWAKTSTVRKMDLILRSIERMLQTQLSMARRFKLQVLRRYNIKFSKMRNFMLETPWLNKLKSTGGWRTNILQICSPRLYHCATSTHTIKAKFLHRYRYFLPYLTSCVIFRANRYKVVENALPHMLLKLIIDRV